MLAGAEEGVRKSNCRVVKINKEETNHYFPVQRLTTVVWLSSRDGTYLQLVDDRRAVIVRSKVERPLTLPSSIFSKLYYYFMHASKLSTYLRLDLRLAACFLFCDAIYM